MAQDIGKMIALVGVLGGGAYLFVEYNNYNSVTNTLASQAAATGANQASALAQIQAAIPFMTWLMIQLGMSSPTSLTQAQQNVYAML